MAFRQQRDAKLAKDKKRAKVREPAKCRFCREKWDDIDYKDLGVLTKLVSSQGKMFSRKRSGNCAAHQRMTRNALKRARYLALMPFCG